MAGPSGERPPLPPSKYLCLTIFGYRKEGMSEEAYRRHMIEVSAPLTKDLMAKYGVKRWTVIHTPQKTRDLMMNLFGQYAPPTADYDSVVQMVFEDLELYKGMMSDKEARKRTMEDHVKFVDIKRSLMTIGWIEEWVNDGQIRKDMDSPWSSFGSTSSKLRRVFRTLLLRS